MGFQGPSCHPNEYFHIIIMAIGWDGMVRKKTVSTIFVENAGFLLSRNEFSKKHGRFIFLWLRMREEQHYATITLHKRCNERWERWRRSVTLSLSAHHVTYDVIAIGSCSWTILLYHIGAFPHILSQRRDRLADDLLNMCCCFCI